MPDISETLRDLPTDIAPAYETWLIQIRRAGDGEWYSSDIIDIRDGGLRGYLEERVRSHARMELDGHVASYEIEFGAVVSPYSAANTEMLECRLTWNGDWQVWRAVPMTRVSVA